MYAPSLRRIPSSRVYLVMLSCLYEPFWRCCVHFTIRRVFMLLFMSFCQLIHGVER